MLQESYWLPGKAFLFSVAEQINVDKISAEKLCLIFIHPVEAQS